MIKNLREHGDLPLLLLIAALLVSAYGRGGNNPLTLFLTQTLILSALLLALFLPARRGALLSVWSDRKGLVLLVFFCYAFFRSYFSTYNFASYLVVIDLVTACAILVILSSYETNLRSGLLFEILFLIVSLHALISLVRMFFDEYGRVRGFFVSPVHFSAYVSMGVAIGVMLVIDRPDRKGRFLPEKLLLLLIVVDVTAIALSSTRSGLLAVAPPALLLIWKRWGRRSALILTVTGAVLFAYPLYVRFFVKGDPFGGERFKIWGAVLEGFRDNPLFGLGPGMFWHVHHLYNFPSDLTVARFAQVVSVADSQFIQILVEWGLLGALFLLLFVLVIHRPQAKFRETWLRTALLFCPVLIHALFCTFLHSPANLFFVATLVALTMSDDGRKEHLEPKLSRTDLFTIAVMIFFFFTAAAFRPFIARVSFIKAYNAKTAEPYMENLSRAVRFNRIQPHYYNNLAEKLLASEGKLDLKSYYAIHRLLEKAIGLNDREHLFHRNMARLYRRGWTDFANDLVTFERAVGEYQRAVELAPYNPFLRMELYDLFFQGGREGKAHEILSRVIAMEPEFVTARLLEMKHHVKRGEIREGRRKWEELKGDMERRKGYRPFNDYEKRILEVDPELYRELSGYFEDVPSAE